MPSSSNKLLASLSMNDFDLIAPHLESVTLGIRRSLEKPNKRINAAYFPESGFASVVAIQSGGKEIEVGLIGREGMTGLPIVLGDNRSPHATYMQAAGTGHCIPSTELRKATQNSRSLRDSLLKTCKRSACKPLTPQSATLRPGWTGAWRAGS
jgi:CRP-like cAMP-binding protein